MSWPGLLERRWFALVVVAAWSLAYLPNLGTRPLRLEEGRRATPAREMLATGDFVKPTLYGDTYLNKPPLYFWLVAAASAGEVDPLATRLPSVLAALGCALIALRFAHKNLDRPTRSLAALFVLSAATLLDKGTLGEIDSTLCYLVAAALGSWWGGNSPEGQSPRSWLAVGLLLGLAGLLKGPVGPVLFYLTIGPYLVWQNRWRRLLTLGHLACVLLAILPSAAWIFALLDRGVISLPELMTVWQHQLGANEAAETLSDPSGRTSHLLSHYSEFPLQVIAMLFPAVLFVPLGLRRAWAARHGLPEDLRQFLVCGILGPVLVFYLYPESRPRHLMPAFFPACVLAAMVVSGLTRLPKWEFWQQRTGLLLSLAPGVLGVMGLLFAIWLHPAGLPIAFGVLGIGVAWSALAVRATLRTAEADGALILGANLTSGMLAFWFVVNAVVVPWQATRVPEFAARELAERLPTDEPLYTTRTFPGKGEGYYNLQFHLAHDVRATDMEMLKRSAPCYAVVTAEERAQLEAEGWLVEELGRIARKGLAEVQIIRLAGTR